MLGSLSESVLGLPHGRYAESAEQYKETIMPKKDGKGPKGQGPKSGRGKGNCK